MRKLMAIAVLATVVGASVSAEARWYGPGVYYEYGPVYAPPPVYVVPHAYPPAYYVPAPAPPMSAPIPPPPQSWYFCENPQGYYPYVDQCATAWRRVPAAPPR